LAPAFTKETRVITRRLTALAGVAVLLAAGSSWAHHAISAVFDTTKKIKIVGELTEVDWVNPHIFIHLKVKNNAGGFVAWKVESSPPRWFQSVGANSNTFRKHVGETVTVDAQPSKDGSTYSYLLKITFANGDTLEGATSQEAEAARQRK
jgi:hypothetical protein